MRIEERERVVKSVVFIADDGTEFDNSRECHKYEMNMAEDKKKLLEPKRIKGLDHWYPYEEYTDTQTHDYYWYNIETEEELNLLKQAYGFSSEDYNIPFPEIICVDSPEYDNHCWWSTLSSMISNLNEFFNITGYEIVKKGD